MIHLPSRRTFLLGTLGAAIGLGVSACAGSGPAADPGASGPGGQGPIEQPDVSVAVFPSFNGIGAALAIQEGILQEKGLNGTLVLAGTPAEGTPQLLGGKVQFAMMDMTVLAMAKAKGVPMQMVAPGGIGKIPPHDGPLGFVNLWVRSESNIASVKDLTDALVAIPQINSQIWVDVRTAIDNAGGDSSKTRFSEAPNAIAALKAGQADCTITAEPAGTRTLSDPTVKPLAPVEFAGGGVAYAYACTHEFAAKNPNTVKAFAEGILAANKKANADKEASVRAAASMMNVDEALLNEAIFPLNAEEHATVEDIGASIERMKKYGLLTDEDAPKAEDLIAQL